MLFNKKNNENNDLNEVYIKIDALNEDIQALSKNIIGLNIMVNQLLSEVRKELPMFADTIISELNNSLDDIIYPPISDCACADVTGADKDDYIFQVYQRLSKRKNMGSYSPRGLFFDGYNFIVRIGFNRGKISFTINDVEYFKRNLGDVCKTIVENNYRYHMFYNESNLSKKVFAKFLFNIIEGTFDNLEPFKQNPIK